MYSIPDLETFLAVARANSVTQAARQLNISPATTSHRLQKLEDALNVQLFYRNSRKLVLSEEGQIFFQRIEKILEDLYQTECEVGAGQLPLRGSLRTTMSPWILSRVLMPYLEGFRNQFPELSLNFLTVDRFVPLVEEAQDCAIRIGNLNDSSLIAHKLCDNKRIICAAPDFIKKFGFPETLEDLQDAHWVCLPWQTSFDVLNHKGKRLEIRAKRNVAVSSSDMLTSGAVQGLGLALKSRLAIQSELETGQLIEVMPSFLMPETAPIWFVHPPSAKGTRKVSEFLKVTKKAFQDFISQNKD